MVTLAMTDAPTHGLPGHTGFGAGVVGLVTNDQAVLVGIIATHSHRGVTGRGHGQLPTLSAVSFNPFAPLPFMNIADRNISAQGAAFPAAVNIIFVVIEGPEGVSDIVSSAVTVVIPADAQIPTHLFVVVSIPGVVAGVGVVVDQGVTRVSRPRFNK